MKPSNPLLTACAALIMLVCQGSAIAQIGSLPASITNARTVSASDSARIAEFVSTFRDNAVSDNPFTSSQARSELMSPLSGAIPSVAFRRAYDEALTPVFDALPDDIGGTLTKLRIAGELGTVRAARLITEALDHDDDAVRVFAAGRIGRVLRMTAASGLAMPNSELDSFIERAGRAAMDARILEVRDACARSLGAGGSLPSRDLGAQRGRCVELMALAAAPLLDNPDADELREVARICVRAAGDATASLSDVGQDATSGAVRENVALAGEMIALGFSKVVRGTMPGGDDRAVFVTLVRSGEALLYFALREHAELNGRNPGNVEQTNLAALLEANEDRDFRDAAALLLGPGSPVVTQFGFEDDRFIN